MTAEPQEPQSPTEHAQELARALEVERRRLEEVFRRAPSFMAVLRGPTFNVEMVNAAFYNLVGHRTLIGRPLFDAIPEVRGQGMEQRLSQVVETGEPFIGSETPVTFARSSSGRLEQRYIDFIYAPLADIPSVRWGVMVHGTDVTSHVEARRALEVANARLRADTAEREAQHEQLQQQAVELEAQTEELHAVAAQLEERTEAAELTAAALADQERQLRMLVDAIPTLAWTARPDGFIDWYNARWYEYTGTTADQMEGWGWQTVHHPATLPQVLERWQGSIDTGTPFEMTFPLRGADGQFRDFLTRVAPVTDADGQITRWFGTNTDVEAERRARRASEQRHEERLREQFEKLPVPTFLWEVRGEDFVLLECNEAARGTMPTVGDAGLGHLHSEIFPDRHEVRAQFRRALREDVVLLHTVEPDVGSPLGQRRIDLTIGPQQPDRVLVHALDVTERTELEAQLRQAQKMDAVGRLAGGVAHDFNNLLTVIGAHSTFLLESLPADDPQREDAEAIYAAGLRAAGLTRQLLAFSRKQLLRPEILDLNGIVDDARRMLERLLGETIAIVTHLAPDLPPVLADPTQLDQVLMNLAVNSRDAMPAGGRLTIMTARVTGPSEPHRSGKTAAGIVPAGDYIELTVADEGTGIDDATHARLFEPFFTTKAMGQGTGLGLATVYGIVKQSGGYVLVDSAPGAGTAFHIYLPARSEALGPPVPAAPRVGARGEETILLIEDEAAVRTVARHILERLGYHVLVADSGVAALALSAALAHPIDLVLSDVVMPGMRGAEAVRQLQAERPGLKVLFMSGYTDDEVLRQGIISAAVAFVNKPFSADALAHAVREALDSEPTSVARSSSS